MESREINQKRNQKLCCINPRQLSCVGFSCHKLLPPCRRTLLPICTSAARPKSRMLVYLSTPSSRTSYSRPSKKRPVWKGGG